MGDRVRPNAALAKAAEILRPQTSENARFCHYFDRNDHFN
jgi:hypothetical protein